MGPYVLALGLRPYSLGMISKPNGDLKLVMQKPGNILVSGNIILGLTSRTKQSTLSIYNKIITKLVFNFTYKLFNLILKYVTFW